MDRLARDLRIAARASAVLVLLLCGCQQPGFQAASLPPQFAAPVIRDSQRLNLTTLAQATVRSDVVERGDVLDVTIATGLDQGEPTRQLLRVADNGTINVPLIGFVRVADLDLNRAEYAVGRASVERDVFRNPQITIRLESRRSHRVTVMGAVEKPGDYDIPASNSDLLAALVAAGGLREDAGTIVEVRRRSTARMEDGVTQAGYAAPFQSGPWQATTVNLANSQSVAQTDLRLVDGTVVMVPSRPPDTIYVTGLVNKSDGFEIPPDQDIRLLDALALAGGRKLEIADRVQIVRQVPNQPQPIAIAASVRQAKKSGLANIRLAPGDVVHVEETPTTFAIETLRNFLRFGFTSAIPGI